MSSQKDGILTVNSVGIGTVTRKMIRERAVEIAQINGRSAHSVSKNDWEDAKAELSYDTGPESRESALELVESSTPWDPNYGSSGFKTLVSGGEDSDSDSEGRSTQEQLMDEGIADAEHDQMLQASLLPEDEE